MVVYSVNCYDESFTFALYSREYKNGQKAIEAIDLGCNELWGKLTVAVDTTLGEGEIAVKTWNENFAWVPATLEALPDYFEDTGRRIPCGHAEAHVWKLKLPIPNISEYDSLKWYKE